MNGIAITTRRAKGPRSQQETPLSKLTRFILIALFDVAAIWFLQNAIVKGFEQLAITVGVITIMLNLIFLLPQAHPFRWLALGLSFLLLFIVYPIIFTVYVAFTNYGDGHLLTKEQAIPLIEKATYLPEAGKTYSWTAFKSPAGEYALWLVSPEGETFLAKPGEEIVPAKPGDPGIGEADTKGIPASMEGYQRVSGLFAPTDKQLPTIKFGLEGGTTVQVNSPSNAAQLEIRFNYDPRPIPSSINPMEIFTTTERDVYNK
jgi:hypothetical protein